MGERVHVGRAGSQGDPPASPPPGPPPIDYGRADPVGDRWRRFTGFFEERMEGLFEFVGQLIATFGGARRIGFAAAIACLAGGLGECLHGGENWGVFWM